MMSVMCGLSSLYAGREERRKKGVCRAKMQLTVQFSVVCSGVVWSDMMLASDDLLFMCSVTKQKY